MGRFDRFKRISDPVHGTAQVVSVTGAPEGHGSAACGMHLVVTVPGVPSFPAEGTYMVKMSKWPRAGMVLPITASRSRPAKFKVRWDQVPTNADQAAEQAARLADAINAYVVHDDRPASPAAPDGAAQDRLGRLERLAALRRSGAISTEEFERLKAEILDG